MSTNLIEWQTEIIFRNQMLLNHYNQNKVLAHIAKPSNNDYDNDGSDNCDYDFDTFDNFGVKNDQKVSQA